MSVGKTKIFSPNMLMLPSSAFLSIPDAANLLYQQPYAYSHNILLVDGSDVRVLEHPQGVNGMMRTAGSPLHNDLAWGKTNQVAVVNFFALPGYANGRTSFNVLRWNRLKELATFGRYVDQRIRDEILRGRVDS